ncbi:MAG: DsbA family protein, partial [Brachymonas sp.]
LLRLGLACHQAGLAGDCNRYVTETIFRHVWQGGHDAADPQRLQALVELLKPLHLLDDPAIKAQLRTNTDEAIARGVFGVPMMEVDGQRFWGLDSLPMLRAYLQGDSWFDSSAWRNAADLPTGIVRSRG